MGQNRSACRETLGKLEGSCKLWELLRVNSLAREKGTKQEPNPKNKQLG